MIKNEILVWVQWTNYKIAMRTQKFTTKFKDEMKIESTNHQSKQYMKKSGFKFFISNHMRLFKIA